MSSSPFAYVDIILMAGRDYLRVVSSSLLLVKLHCPDSLDSHPPVFSAFQGRFYVGIQHGSVRHAVGGSGTQGC